MCAVFAIYDTTYENNNNCTHRCAIAFTHPTYPRRLNVQSSCALLFLPMQSRFVFAYTIFLQFQIIEIAFAMEVNFVLAHWKVRAAFSSANKVIQKFEHWRHSMAQQGDGSN